MWTTVSDKLGRIRAYQPNIKVWLLPQHINKQALRSDNEPVIASAENMISHKSLQFFESIMPEQSPSSPAVLIHLLSVFECWWKLPCAAYTYRYWLQYDFVQVIPNIPKLSKDKNPATWVLQITSANSEAVMGVNFAEIYVCSETHRLEPSIQPNIKFYLNLVLPFAHHRPSILCLPNLSSFIFDFWLCSR